MERQIKLMLIDRQIKAAWGDPNKVRTASDMHFRAQEIDRLEKKRAELLKP